MAKLGLLTSERRGFTGGKTHTHYIFEPWAEIEERDVADFLAYRVKKGCECNGSVTFEQMFATEEDILSGKLVPVWAGRFGSPAAALPNRGV